MLDVHEALLKRHPDLLLLLVPRHPERFPAVRDLLDRRGFNTIARTEGRPAAADTNVFFGDTMGEVPLFYAASDVAFVAGSLMPIGGHNLLEPAAEGVRRRRESAGPARPFLKTTAARSSGSWCCWSRC